MTDEMVQFLMSAGLSKTQATSVTTEKTVQALMQEDGKALIAEAKEQVRDTRALIRGLAEQNAILTKEIKATLGTMKGIYLAQEEYGHVDDERAKNTIALFAALISVGKKAGARGEKLVDNASYIVYAYLCGKAENEVKQFHANNKQMKSEEPPLSDREELPDWADKSLPTVKLPRG